MAFVRYTLEKLGFPVGLQLVARRLNERKLYQLSFAFEKTFDWRNNANDITE